MKLIILIILSILSTSCNSQEKIVNPNKKSDSDNVEIESPIIRGLNQPVYSKIPKEIYGLEQMEME
jgi:hypothetical protein